MVGLKTKLPQSFFEEETRWGYTITPEVKKIWAVELDLLAEFDRVCEKMGLDYFLDAGTLLGAARDGKMIPWDDDIDVIMFRKDYDRLVSEGEGEFAHPYFLQTGYNDHDYFRGHCQLRNSDTCAILPNELGKVHFDQGIFLDIFVLDDIFPEKLEEQFERVRYFRRMRRIYLHPDEGNIIKRAGKYAARELIKLRYKDLHGIYAEYDDVFRNKTGEQTEYVGDIFFWTDIKDVLYFRRDWYKDKIRVEFEGVKTYIPSGYDEILKAYYGENYMTPQQVDSYHSSFGQMIFDVDRSYKEVLRKMGME